MIAFLSFALPFTLYLSLPSTLWNFDGVACAAALELGQPAYLFHSNHLLYAFFGFLFWKGLGAPMGIARALPALQLFTSLLACLGLIGLYRLLLPLVKDRWSALLLCCGLAVTSAFWVWSVEAQVYTLGFLALAWSTVILVQSTHPQKYLWVGMLHGGAVLGHVMHVLWVIPALYWIVDECRTSRLSPVRALRPYGIALGLTSLIPYLLVLLFVIAPGRPLGRVLIWLKGSAGLTPDRHWSWHSVGWSGPWIWLKSTLPSLWGSFMPYGKEAVAPWIWGLTAVSAGLLIAFLIKGGSRKNERLMRFSWLWIGVYGVFLSTWEPDVLCYRLTDILPLGVLLALGLSRWKPAVQMPLTALFLGSTLTVNALTQIVPMNRPEENQLYQETLSLSKMSSPDSLYITNGGSAWLYLLYFTGRTAWNSRSFEPQQLAEEISRQKRSRPVYVQEGSVWQQVH